MSNVVKFPYQKRSYIGVTWTARDMAMDGATAEAIHEATGMHMMACERIFQECAEHRSKFLAALLK
jgi:hypothetical protein